MAQASKDIPEDKRLLRAYRLCAAKYIDTALSGEGSRRVGGRWNSPGVPAVYLGESRALTALELLVHLPSPLSRAREFVLLEVTFPAALVSSPGVTTYIPDWSHEPPAKSSIAEGDSWLRSEKFLAYRLPSTIIPEESIYLLNPHHKRFGEVRLERKTAFCFDSRLTK